LERPVANRVPSMAVRRGDAFRFLLFIDPHGPSTIRNEDPLHERLRLRCGLGQLDFLQLIDGKIAVIAQLLGNRTSASQIDPAILLT